VADGAPQAAVKKRMLRIASGCATREAFISVFRRFCDRDSIFIATRTPKATGADLHFSITLADGAPLIGGTGTVLESWSDETSPYGRAGMRIRFDDLSPSGRALIDELMAAAKQADLPKPSVPVPGAAAALAALAKVGGSSKTPPPTPVPGSKPVPAIKPLPSVIPKPGDPRNRTMLGMTPLKRPPRLEGTPAPVAMPQVARDVEVKLPPPPRPTPGTDDSDDQTTGVAARFHPDASSTFLDEASWDEAADHVLGGTRAKGSDLVLPANPLGGVKSESLDAFVECTLYEETGTFAIDSEATTPGAPPRPDDYAQDDLTIPPWLQGPVAESPFAESIAMPPPSLPFEPDRRTPDPRSSSEMRALLVDAGKAFDPSKVPVAQPILPGSRRGHWPLTFAIAAATGLVGIAIGAFALGRGGDDGGDAEAEPAASQPAPPTEVARAVEPAVPAPVPAPAPAAARAAAPDDSDVIAQPADASKDEEPPADPPPADPPPAEPPPPAASAEPVDFSRLTGKLGKDRCGADIKSRPDGADVLIGETRLGATPLKVVLPCGEHALELRRPRYSSLKKPIALEQGKLDTLELNLTRPEHRLRITSVPSGAAVTVNGRSAGNTPATVTVNGFEQARVSVSLAGHKTWSSRVYVRDSTTSVSAKLSADKAKAPAKAPAKSAARPGKRGK
jgi:hypothetical protein